MSERWTKWCANILACVGLGSLVVAGWSVDQALGLAVLGAVAVLLAVGITRG